MILIIHRFKDAGKEDRLENFSQIREIFAEKYGQCKKTDDNSIKTHPKLAL